MKSIIQQKEEIVTLTNIIYTGIILKMQLKSAK